MRLRSKYDKNVYKTNEYETAVKIRAPFLLILLFS